ncbi:MAG: hypothetical protein WED34_03125, partial [Planctomycetales bacterium]
SNSVLLPPPWYPTRPIFMRVEVDSLGSGDCGQRNAPESGIRPGDFLASAIFAKSQEFDCCNS